MNICRICYEEGTSTNPLATACSCKGSIGFLHKQCLQTWLHISLNQYCELCKTIYTIDEISFEILFTPSPNLLWLSRHSFLLYIDFMLIYLAYQLYTPTNHLSALMGFSLWRKEEFYRIMHAMFVASPYILCIVTGIQCIIMIPAIMVVKNKLNYVWYLCSSRRISGTLYVILLLVGHIASFYYMASSVLTVILVGHMYRIHSQIIRQLNMDALANSRWLLDE